MRPLIPGASPLNRSLFGVASRLSSASTFVASDNTRPSRHLAQKRKSSSKQIDEEHSCTVSVDANLQPETARAVVHMNEYHVQRTPTRNLPVYNLSKRGGNLKQTRLRKISGQSAVLLQHLQEFLKPQPEWMRINAVTGHIEMKGWYKSEIERFLRTKGF